MAPGHSLMSLSLLLIALDNSYAAASLSRRIFLLTSLLMSPVSLDPVCPLHLLLLAALDSDEAKTRGKRTKEQAQAKNRNKYKLLLRMPCGTTCFLGARYTVKKAAQGQDCPCLVICVFCLVLVSMHMFQQRG